MNLFACGTTFENTKFYLCNAYLFDDVAIVLAAGLICYKNRTNQGYFAGEGVGVDMKLYC